MSVQEIKNKYQIKVLQEKDTWTAQIARQVSSKKVHISKQQSDFETQEQAQQWADTALATFINTQQTANNRHSKSRKQSEETKRLRSARRAERTEAEKLVKEKAFQAETINDSSE